MGGRWRAAELVCCAGAVSALMAEPSPHSSAGLQRSATLSVADNILKEGGQKCSLGHFTSREIRYRPKFRIVRNRRDRQID
jgi:hypothetical protein